MVAKRGSGWHSRFDMRWGVFWCLVCAFCFWKFLFNTRKIAAGPDLLVAMRRRQVWREPGGVGGGGFQTRLMARLCHGKERRPCKWMLYNVNAICFPKLATVRRAAAPGLRGPWPRNTLMDDSTYRSIHPVARMNNLSPPANNLFTRHVYLTMCNPSNAVAALTTPTSKAITDDEPIHFKNIRITNPIHNYFFVSSITIQKVRRTKQALDTNTILQSGQEKKD